MKQPDSKKDLKDSELLLLYAEKVRRSLSKLEPLHQYLLEKTSDLEDQIEVQKVKKISDALLVTTHALMDFLEKDKNVREDIPFSLRTSLSKIIQLYSHLFSENQGSFEFFVPPSIPDALIGSPSQFKRIVSLFFSQGLAFKCPVYGTFEEGSTKDSLHFLLQIQKESGDSQVSSQGLDHFLYEKLIQKVDGKSWIENNSSALIFHLELPIRIHAIEEEPEQKRFNLAGKKILILDSTRASLQILSRVMESWQVEVTYILSLEEIQKLLLESKKRPSFDFVIVEKELFAQKEFSQLLEKTELQRHTPFILIASNPERGDAALCIQQGIQAYLTQPLHGIELWEVLQHLLNQNRGASSLLTRHVLLEEDRRFKILVWDPQFENQDKFFQLKQQGHAIHELSDLNEFSSKLEQTAYDLILMDSESLEESFKISQLRNTPKNQRTPIIGLSKKEVSDKKGFDALLASPLADEDLFNWLAQSS